MSNSTLNNQTMAKSMNGLNIINADQIFTNSFSATTLSSTNLSTANLTATGSVSFPTSSIIDSYLSSNVVLKNANNNLTGLNVFNNYIPHCGLVPTGDTELTNKKFVDDSFAYFLTQAHTWAGVNNFSVLPTSTALPTASNQLITKDYGDNSYDMIGVYLSLLSRINTWLAVNTYTGGITASAIQAINFGTNAPTMSGANIGTGSIPLSSINGSSNIALLNGNQTFTGTNAFSNTLTGLTPATSDNSTNVATTAFVKNQGYITTANGLLSSVNTWTNDNTWGSSNDGKTMTFSNQYFRMNPNKLYITSPPISEYDQGITTSSNSSVKISNTAYGTSSATTGYSNVIIGTSIVNNASNSLNRSVVIGSSNMNNVASGSESISIGYFNNGAGTSSSFNVTIGSYNLISNTTGISNLGIGNGNISGSQQKTGSFNTGIGKSTTGSNGNSDCNKCVGIGAYALANCGTNIGNNVVGNVAMGFCALNGSGNSSAGYDNIHFLDGNYNSGFGNLAGLKLSGASSNNTFLGAYTDVANLNTTYQNSTSLGYGSIITASNQIKIGRSTETTVFDGAVDINGVCDVNGANQFVVNGVFYPHYAYPTTYVNNATIPTPFYSMMFFQTSTYAFSITLPTITSAMIGVVCIKCRRLGGNTTYAINATPATGNVIIAYNATTSTATGAILPAGVVSAMLCCVDINFWAVFN